MGLTIEPGVSRYAVMSNYEETARAFENDHSYAPVGLFVLPFWTGALLLGLFGFLITVLTATGRHTFIVHEERGIYDGIGLAILLIVLSALNGLLGRTFALKKRDLAPLWKLAIAIPVVVVLLAVVTVATYN
jgi:hypothetical protein